MPKKKTTTKKKTAKKKTTKKKTTTKAKAPGKRTDVGQLAVGNRLSETQYYEVIEQLSNKIKVRNERGYEFYIGNDIVAEGMFSANQFHEEVEISRTELCEILENAGDTIFTVNFNKQLKQTDVVAEILEAVEEDKSARALKTRVSAAVKKGVKGEVRTLVGYLVRTEAKMGRSQVIDLEAPPNHRWRLVDHRTINWMIHKNVKYVAK